MKINSIISVFVSIAAMVLCGVAFTLKGSKDAMFIAMDIILICAIMGFAVVLMLLKNDKYRIYTAIPISIMSMCIFIPSVTGWRIAVFVVFLLCYIIMLIYLFLSKSIGSVFYLSVMEIFLIVYTILEMVASATQYYVLFYVGCMVSILAVCAYLYDYAFGAINEYLGKKSPKKQKKNKSSKGNK